MDREKALKRAIRRLTKRIGEAKRASDFNEVENLRKQRGTFANQLLTEFEQGFIVTKGKTSFVPIEEAAAHYKRPEIRKKVGVANATNDLLQARDKLIKRLQRIDAMTAKDVKTEVLGEVEREISKVEEIIASINEQVGNEPIDFDQIDAKRLSDDDDLDGIDLSSLL